ncbi:LLM class flavin-dependent oxidoreductase [Amycolatopsis sp. MtRt-6]|uniref:LLM class flavin-dependent oxidoreductase n=1 Tax=Amycolatopsis sp. MtRt-6 TaxID=2792782 RepID=UPI001A906D83|nr:LLM class flavin-dependent oxidoreductase [Amycolatopsis sp. MtRt-6]
MTSTPSPAALARAAREGDGYIGGSVPVEMVGQSFDAARTAWKEAGREDPPRLVGIAYFAFGDVERGRAGVRDYYSFMGDDTASMIAGTLSGGTDAVRATVKAFDELGADELVLNPTVADLDEVSRLADAVL